LGLTPLSIEVPYSDSAVEFVFKKAGFESKTVYVVPNLPSPLFATLRRAENDADGGVAPTRRFAPMPGPPSRRVRAPAAEKPTAPKSDRLDEDGVLEPSIR
jgi:hypothetical protein